MALSTTPLPGSGKVPSWTSLPENAVYRISSRESASSPSPRKPSAKSKTFSQRLSPGRLRTLCMGAAWTVAAITLGTALWQLQGERTRSAALTLQVSALKTSLDDHLQKLEESRSSLNAAEADRSQMISAIRSSLRKQEDLREDLDDWKLRLADEQADKDRTVATWTTYGNRMAETLNQTNELHAAEQAASDRQLASMELKTAELGQANQSLAQNAAQWENSARQLSQDNHSLQSDLDRARACLASLEQDNRNLSSCNARLQGDVLNLQSCINGLRSTICSLEARIRCLESELSQARNSNGNGGNDGSGRNHSRNR